MSTDTKKILEIRIDMIVLIVAGLLGLIASFILVFIPDINSTIAIITAIFSSTALVIAAIESVGKTIVETFEK